MSNPFSMKSLVPKLSNYPVKKGGAGSGRHKARELSFKASNLAEEVSENGADKSFANQHRELASQHLAASSEERAAGNTRLADMHELAASRHTQAAYAHEYADGIVRAGFERGDDDLSPEAEDAVANLSLIHI